MFRRSKKASSADANQDTKSPGLSRKASAQMSDDFTELGGNRQDSDMGKIPSAGTRMEDSGKAPSKLEPTSSFRWDNTQLDDAHRNMLRESQSSAEAAKRDSTSTPPAPAASENSSEVSKVPAVIPEETEAERQERAWAEAEAREARQLAAAAEEKQRVASNAGALVRKASEEQMARRSAAAEAAAATEPQLNDYFEFQAMNQPESTAEPGTVASAASADIAATNPILVREKGSAAAAAEATFVENVGPEVVSLGTGAFGKVWLGRAKLELPPLPTLTRSMTNSSNDLLCRASMEDHNSSFRRSVPGRGSSTVAPLLSLSPGVPVALKEISVAKLVDGIEGPAAARKEAKFLARCQGHPNVMRFFGLFETSSSLWLVTENCAGGDLHARLNQRREVFLQREQQREELGIGISNEPSSKEGAGNIPPWGGLNEDTAAACVASLLGALAHLHKQNVAHRDVKPENMLIRQPFTFPSSPSTANVASITSTDANFEAVLSDCFTVDDGASIALADFGLAATCNGRSLKKLCGSTQYLAPEVLRTSGASAAAAASGGMATPLEGYDMQCDLWSVGVVAYRLLGGDLPRFCSGTNIPETELAVLAFAGCAPSSDPVDNEAASAMLDQYVADSEAANTNSGSSSTDAKNATDAPAAAAAPTSRPTSGDFTRKPWFREGRSGSAWLAPLASHSNGYGSGYSNNAVWDSRSNGGKSGVSLEARSFICACLHPIPERRPKAHVLLQHPWVKGAVSAAASAAASNASSTASSHDGNGVASQQPFGALHPLPEEEGGGTENSDDDDGDEGAVVVGDSDDVLAAGNDSKSLQLPSVDGAASDTIPGAKNLPRMCSDIGVGSASVTPVATNHVEGNSNPSTTSPTKKKQPARMWHDGGDDLAPVTSPIAVSSPASSTAAAANLPSLELDESSDWWEGVLPSKSALLCSLTKKPFEDPVLSLEDGKTYERSALTRRNLSRAAHERQAAAWVEAQSEATEALVNDGSLSLAQKLSRLVAYRSAGLLGRPPTSTNAERAFEAAKGRVINTKQTLASKGNAKETPQVVAAAAEHYASKARQAGMLTPDEKAAFLGDPQAQSRTNGGSDDTVQQGPVRRRSSIVRADRDAGLIPNEAMKLAVKEVRDLVETLRRDRKLLLSGASAAPVSPVALSNAPTSPANNSSSSSSMNLLESFRGAFMGNSAAVAAKPTASGGNAPLPPPSSCANASDSDSTADPSMSIATVVVSVDKNEGEKVFYRTTITTKGGNRGTCSHRFGEYWNFYKELSVMGGVAAYMGGQATWAAVNDLFPNRDTTTDLKRKLGIGLSEDQVEERRAGLENWLKAVLMPSCARAARDAAAKGVASPSGGAAAAAKDDRDDTGNSQADKPVPVPIKNLMWVFLRLDTRVTHL